MGTMKTMMQNAANWWQQPDFILQVHPTFADEVPTTTTKLRKLVGSSFGFSSSRQLDDGPSLDVDSKPFGVDPMASATISNDKDEFVSLRPLSKTYLSGVGGRVPVEGIGTLTWEIEDDLGLKHLVQIDDAYYCSSAPMRLLCPQQWASQRLTRHGPDHNTSFTTKESFSKLQWSSHTLTIPHDDRTNLPLWRTAPSYHKVACIGEVSPSLRPAVVSDDEESIHGEQPSQKDAPYPFEFTTHSESLENKVEHPEEEKLPTDQAEFYRLHCKYGHVPFKILKNMAAQGIIPKKFKDCHEPKCSSCLYGKQTRRPWRDKSKPGNVGGRKPKHPGDCVSVDQLISKTPGLIAQVKGWLTNSRYTAATVFADHASGLSYVHVSQSTTAEETLEAKHAFEAFAADLNVTIKHYHADNGRFSEAAFMDAVQQAGQSISFCGVGAHHQNGVAERRIRDLTEHARTMLLHASHRWPKAINAHLWPYALRQAAHIRNHLPRESEGGSPIEKFAKAEVHNKLFHKHQHTFGCPVYVLDAPLQSGLGTKPKWSERSRVGAYLGHSSNHAQSVALVLNLKTGHVSPQFHVVFDDSFQTVLQDHFSASLWQEKANLHGSLSEDVLVEPKIENSLRTKWAATLPPQPTPEPNDPEAAPEAQPQASEGSQSSPQSAPSMQVPLRRSERIKAKLEREAAQAAIPAIQAHLTRVEQANKLDDGTINYLEPMSMVSSASSGDPDTMHYGDARKQPDWAEFKKAMIKEVNDFDERGHWTLVRASQIDRSRPHDIISAIWSFKRKRTPTGELIKHKARLCAHGGQQTHGVTYWDTFSPVVNWHTLRTFLTLSLIKGWKARSVDFVLAYPQADLDKDIYMRVPAEFEVNQPGKFFLKLVKNVYGLKDAGRTWHEHLKKGLLDRKFYQSLVDPCVFYKDNLILVIYVDDVICFSPTDAAIDSFIKSMQEEEPQSYILEDQGELKDYLGIEIKELPAADGESPRISISQPHLINKILTTCGLDGDTVTARSTPAAPGTPMTKSGVYVRDKPFNYRSAVGQLNYLAATSRPDIAFAVHQCARFCADPKEKHYKAVKRIARYLHGTKDKGIILNPQGNDIKCYADADFAGNYTSEEAEDPSNLKSRSGFLIFYAGCPIAWQSKLQTEIALSTTESEYISLSQATRTLLFLLSLFREAKEQGFDFVSPDTHVFATCFEDNAGCLELARAPKLRPRTKHIAVKYHHFRSHVYHERENPSGSLKLKYVGTQDQLADTFTKGLSEATFERLRHRISGW